ncbi:hypothetical protein TRFO_13596 [Tritrichomonas foetus]|uniref:Uncharacterized protein n=1 Tax=Tritrichomonas foetus TaxID=1144522 RepID=A0A1J4L1T6_9EUKA|nr:hypothetical protein TRFO_13596 [Tritrichomonas foetus]|eukprot:OHT15932.1 hypothetical protein TRFO_13596 [Tritrichomonas foetus]
MYIDKFGSQSSPIPQSKMETINKKDPILLHPDEKYPPIMKRKIISYPIPHYREHELTEEKVRDVMKSKREYQEQLQAKEALEDIAEFEKRVFGKTSKPPPITITPPSQAQLMLLREIEPPSPTKFYDIYNSPPQSCPISPRTRHIQSELASLPFSQKNSPSERSFSSSSSLSETKLSKTASNSPKKVRPAIWTLLDEPILPSYPNIKYKPEKPKTQPFIPITVRDNSRGIPNVVPGLDELNRRKIEEYENQVRLKYTTDNQIREKQIQERVQKNLSKMRQKREQTSKLITESGQDWPQKLLSKTYMKRMKAEKPQPPSKEDIEAMEFLSRRDEEMRVEMKERQRNLEKENSQFHSQTFHS